MVEELRKRLDFDNTSVCVQTVNRLYAQIIDKKNNAKINRIASTTVEIAELQLLWEKCMDQNQVVASACCEALFCLVQCCHAEYDYVCNTLLSLIPSGSCLTAGLRMLSDLLLLEVTVTLKQTPAEEYQCPFQLRTPPHPFISVVTNRSDCWPALVEQVKYLLRQDDDQLGLCCVLLLKPFLKYVLLNPNPDITQASFRTLLYTALLQLCSEQINKAPQMATCLVDFLIQVTPLMQTKPLTELTETVACLHSLTHFICHHPDKLNLQLVSAALNLLCVCKTLLDSSGDLNSSLTLLVEISDIVALPSVAIAMLSHLLVRMPMKYVEDVLRIVKNTLSKSSSSHLCSILVLPVLQVILTSQASIVMATRQKIVLQSLAKDILAAVENFEGCDPEARITKINVPITDPWHSAMVNCTHYAEQFQTAPKAAFDWLTAVQSEMRKGDHVTDDVILLLSHLLLRSDGVLVDRCLAVIRNMAAKDMTKAPNFLSLLLYRLGREKDPDMKVKLLYTIPRTATHKACVGPVLKTLQTLATVPSMEAVAIRLLTSLWKLQDRCFPYLQKLLTLVKPSAKSVPSGGGDILVAKAASVRDVCQERPHQHVSEMLTAVHWFISEFPSPSGGLIPPSVDGTVVALALEGLYYLCKSEVVDIRTTWNALSSNFNRENRPLVNKKLCEIFSLVPDLNVDTEEYEEFRDEVVTILWSFAKNSNPVLSGAAYSALSYFDEEEFRLDDLPENISSEVKAKITAAKERERGKRQQEDDDDEEEEDGEDEDFDIPGDCYVKLMMQVDPVILNDFQKFLTSLAAQEMNNMPRGVYHSALKGQKKSASKAVTGVPALVQRQYDKNKLPGLKQGLAAALLLSYDPPMETGKDGKPVRRHLVSLGRTYQKTLSVLLNEVPVQPSEWYRTMLMPQMWTMFMEKLFTAMLEGRKAELEMQLGHREMDVGEYEIQNKQKTAWLWVRDKVTDLLKSASRGNPSLQYNSVLAMTGLAVAITKHTSTLEKSDVEAAGKIAPEHTSQSIWLSMAIDTMMCILDRDYVPTGRIFNMCQQRTSGRNTLSSSTLAKAAAAMSIPQLASLIVTTDSDKVFRMMKMLTVMLPGQPSADESPVLQFHCGLGLGVLLGRLYQERFSEVTGNEGAMATMKALDVLEQTCLNPGVENINGCMLGLGVALSSLCGLGATHSRVHVTSTHAKLMALLETWEDVEKSGIAVQTLCMCLACVTVSACNCNYLSAEVATLVLQKCHCLCQQYPQVGGISISTGLLCGGLCASGHASSSEVMDQLFETWSQGVASPTKTALEQTAMLHGLVTLVSMDTSFIHINTEVIMTSEVQSKQNQIVKMLTQIITSSDDVGMRSSASWLIAYLYARSTTGTQTKANVPSNYSYLPDTSVIRAIVDFLITAGKEGLETFTPQVVDAAMTTLVNISKSALPPVNWTAILSPLQRMKFGSEVQLKCVQLAVNQCKSASSASMFLQSLLSTSLFSALPEPCKIVLFSSLHVLLKGLPMSKIKPFIESSLSEPFAVATPDNSALCMSVLTGLKQALNLSEPPQSATLLLYKCVESIYQSMPNNIQKWQLSLLSALCDCMCLLPLEVLDRVTNPADQENLLKATYVRCYLFAQGKQPIAWLNPCIDAAMATNQNSSRQVVVWLFACSFLQCLSVQSEHSGVTHRMDWLLELLGHVKGFAYKTNTAPQEHLPTTVKFLLDIFSVAIVTWSMRSLRLSLGLMSFQSNPNASLGEVSEIATGSGSCHHRSQTCNFQDLCSGNGSLESLSLSGMIAHLPDCLPKLLSTRPWDQLTDKVLDWLIVMLDDPKSVLSDASKQTLTETLYATRHLAGFKKTSFWTRAFNRDLFQ